MARVPITIAHYFSSNSLGARVLDQLTAEAQELEMGY